MPLIKFNKLGIYIPQADVYIDPTRAVPKALITHGHSDHARPGHGSYLCADKSINIIRHRLGQKINISSIPYNEPISINGVRFSFHPAGHIIGSAQIRVEYKGEVWVVTGDYKWGKDNTCTSFELVPCHTLVTETTFALPIYKWKPQASIMDEINAWWLKNQSESRLSIISAYSLGKAQRLINNLSQDIGPILTNDIVEDTNQVLRNQGDYIAPTQRLTKETSDEVLKKAIYITSTLGGEIHDRPVFREASQAFVSGWVATTKGRNRYPGGNGFVMSDHVDWKELNQTVHESGAERVFAMHGFTKPFVKWLRSTGLEANEIHPSDVGEEEDEPEMDGL